MGLSNENVIHVKKGSIEYLQFRKLLEYKDIINHAYSLGIDKNYRTARVNNQKLESDEYKRALKDYGDIAESIDTKLESLVKPIQNHTDEVKIVREKINSREPDFSLEQYSKTDGLITNKENILLATTNADCILLLFFDPVKKVIANTHSGWRGTLQRISIKTVEKMKREFNCNPEDIICCICPSIRKCHFEVDEDVKEKFEKEFKDIENIEEIIEENFNNETEKQKWNIDTVAINKILLEREGLKTENIIDSKICSVCNSELIHSYRVEKQEFGLNVALIGLK